MTLRQVMLPNASSEALLEHCFCPAVRNVDRWHHRIFTVRSTSEWCQASKINWAIFPRFHMALVQDPMFFRYC